MLKPCSRCGSSLHTADSRGAPAQSDTAVSIALGYGRKHETKGPCNCEQARQAEAALEAACAERDQLRAETARLKDALRAMASALVGARP